MVVGDGLNSLERLYSDLRLSNLKTKGMSVKTRSLYFTIFTINDTNAAQAHKNMLFTIKMHYGWFRSITLDVTDASCSGWPITRKVDDITAEVK